MGLFKELSEKNKPPESPATEEPDRYERTGWPDESLDVSEDENDWYFAQMQDDDRQHATGPRPPTVPCVWCSGLVTHGELCRAMRESWLPVLKFGKHKGKRLDRVPRDYLLWCWNRKIFRDADLRKDVREFLGVVELPQETELDPA